MDVIFQTNSTDQNRYSMPVEGYGRLFFKKGAYITSDKELIEKMLKHPLKRRGDYRLVTNDELVDKYLSGEEPDVLTKEILDTVSLNGILELGKLLNSTEVRPSLIKIEIEGEPITDKVSLILDNYKINKTKKQVSEEIKEVETVKIALSGDMSAKDAVAFIEKAGRDELTGFLSKDEERKTVLEAYKAKMGE